MHAVSYIILGIQNQGLLDRFVTRSFEVCKFILGFRLLIGVFLPERN